ncbi:MAG: hypothetical protein IJT60_04320 [Clostridia bacterium]|nr:hypothetical protein [Clostridia bacterium]
MKLFPSKDRIRDRIIKTPSELHNAPSTKKNLVKENRKYIIGMAVSLPLLFLVYFVLVGLQWYVIDFIYMGALAILSLTYVIYNKGFRASGVTYEQLSPDLPEEKRREIIESRDSHLQKSKWMLVFIIPLLLVVLTELVIMYIVPLFGGSS